MIVEIKIDNDLKKIDLSKPIDISIPLSGSKENPIAWYLDKPSISPVKDGDWIGKVSEGAAVNFNNIPLDFRIGNSHFSTLSELNELTVHR